MAIALDGDFVVVFFFDECAGRLLEGINIVGLLAESFLKKEPRRKK